MTPKRDLLELELLRVVLKMDDATQRRFMLYLVGLVTEDQLARLVIVAAKGMLAMGRGR